VKSSATADALHELKTMLNKYMGNEKEGDEGSPSVSKSALDNQGAVPLRILQQVPEVHVETTPATEYIIQEDTYVPDGVNKAAGDGQANAGKAITPPTPAA
jgi:hypothetical protein